MTRLRKVLRLLVPAAATVVSVLAVIAPAAASFKYLKPGMEAAEFSLRTLDDQEISFAGLKGSPATLVVFWATWSPKSEPALREAQVLAGRHAGSGLRVVAVNLDRAEIGIQDRAIVEKAARDCGLTGPVAIDPGFAVSTSIGVVANPSLALFDTRGVLVWDGAGWSRSLQQALHEQVETLLGLREPPAAPVVQGHSPAHKALLNFNLGRTFLRQGNQARAQGLFESAAAADPAWAAPRTHLGYLLLQEEAGESAQAESHFLAAVAIDPGDVSALTGLGETLLRSNRAAEAAALLERACALDSTFSPAISGRARALARLGRTAEALTLFAQAIELNARDAVALAGRAACRETEGDLGEAAVDYRRAVELLLGAR